MSGPLILVPSLGLFVFFWLVRSNFEVIVFVFIIFYFVLYFIFFKSETEKEWIQIGGRWEGTGKSRKRGNHNQAILCEKIIYFSMKGKNTIKVLTIDTVSGYHRI